MATTKIDHFGRVVIPKRIRDHLALEPGRELSVTEHDDGVVLKPTDHEPLLKRMGHVLVFTGKVTGDVVDVIRRTREERDRAAWGLDEP